MRFYEDYLYLICSIFWNPKFIQVAIRHAGVLIFVTVRHSACMSCQASDYLSCISDRTEVARARVRSSPRLTTAPHDTQPLKQTAHPQPSRPSILGLSLKMDHSHMDHSHMDHSGMDMPMEPHRCSMNVCSQPLHLQ